MKKYLMKGGEGGWCRVKTGSGQHGGYLNPRLDLWDYGAPGYQWGCVCEGAAQLALAILCDALGRDGLALHLHEEYLKRFVAFWSPHHAATCDALVIDWALSELEKGTDWAVGQAILAQMAEDAAPWGNANGHQ